MPTGEGVNQMISSVVSIDPFSTSLLLYNLVSINALVDIHFRLLELGASNLNVSKGRFFWYYFSASFSYFIRTIFAMIVLVLLVCLVTAIITAIYKMFSASGSVNKQMKEGNVSGAKALMESVKAGISQAVLDQIKKTANFIMNVYSVNTGNKFMKPFNIFTLPDLIKIFLVVLPLYMLFMMGSYAISFYKPIIRPDEENKKSTIMSTNHHYIYFILVCCIITFILMFTFTYTNK